MNFWSVNLDQSIRSWWRSESQSEISKRYLLLRFLKTAENQIRQINSKASEETVSESTENCRFRQPTIVWYPPLQGTPTNIPINRILPETRVIVLNLSCWQCRSIFIKLSWCAPKTLVFWNRVRNDSSRSSKVVDFGTNPLIIWVYFHSRFHGGLRPKDACVLKPKACMRVPWSSWSYLAPFQRYCKFSAENSTPQLIHPNFRVFPWTRLPMLGLLGAKTLS